MNLSMTRLAQRYDIQEMSLVIAIGVMVVIGLTSALPASQAARSWQQLLGFGIHYDNMRPVFGGVGSPPSIFDAKSDLPTLWRHLVAFVSGVQFGPLIWSSQFILLTTRLALIAIPVAHVLTQTKGCDCFGFSARRATATALGEQLSTALQHLLGGLPFDTGCIKVFRRSVNEHLGLVTALPALAAISVFYGRGFTKGGNRQHIITDSASSLALSEQRFPFCASVLCDVSQGHTSINYNVIISLGG